MQICWSRSRWIDPIGAPVGPRDPRDPLSPVGHHSFPYDKFVQQAVCQLVQCQKDASGTPYLCLLRQMRFVSVQFLASCALGGFSEVICASSSLYFVSSTTQRNVMRLTHWRICEDSHRLLSFENLLNWWFPITSRFVWARNFVTRSVEEIEGIWRRSTGEDVLALLTYFSIEKIVVPCSYCTPFVPPNLLHTH